MLLFLGAMCLTAAAHFFLGLNEIPAFWICYVCTRPFGAAFGDLLSAPARDGGLHCSSARGPSRAPFALPSSSAVASSPARTPRRTAETRSTAETCRKGHGHGHGPPSRQPPWRGCPCG
mmetsp:Transcript_9600/g.33153  ORF Transcript_9600/g.33153 Transcript_9600/m.33153 type:complete len:119 (-) Transcript_9600:65-421(-)